MENTLLKNELFGTGVIKDYLSGGNAIVTLTSDSGVYHTYRFYKSAKSRMRSALFGGGICGVIFKKAGMAALSAACKKYKTPLRDGSAVITPAFQMTNAKFIIHAVGPDFSRTPKAFKHS